MVDLLDWLGGLLPDAALAATVWVGLCALVMVGCAQPLRRCVVARAAVLGSLMIGPLVAVLPIPRLNLTELVRQVSSPGSRLEPIQWLVTERSLEGAEVAGRGRLVRRVGAVVYLGGAAVGLGWVGLGCWAARRLVSGTRAARPEAVALYRGLPFALPWGRPVLRVSDRVRRPLLGGAIRPVIVVPSALDSPEQGERLRLSLLHELAHAGRLDPVFGLVAGLAQAVWFFVPPIWWVRAQLRLDQEFLADKLAASAFDRCATSYASSLVGLAAAAGNAGPSSLTEGRASRVGSALSLRVLMLVRCPFPVELRLPRWSWGLAPLGVVGLVMACCVTVQAPASPTSQAAPAHGRLDVARLSLGPLPSTATPEAIDLVLPIPVARAFRLSFEIEATIPELTHLTFAGYSIGGDGPGVLPAAWHRVRLEHGEDGPRAWIDDRPAVVTGQPTSGTDRTGMMGVQGRSERVLHFRNLSATW